MTLARLSEDRFPSLFDNFFNGNFMNWMNTNYSDSNTTIPAVNIKEDENAFNIEVAAPGMQKDDFKLELNNGVLTISSEHKEEKKETKKNKYTCHEFSYQSFHRSFTLPQHEVDSEKIEAKYEDGILKIGIHKREEAKPKPTKFISIK